jgi:hypothetical protein
MIIEETNSDTERHKVVSLQEDDRIERLCGRLDGTVKEDVSMTPLVKQTIQMFRPGRLVILVVTMLLRINQSKRSALVG